MNEKTAKQTDEQVESYKITAVKNVDNGFSLEFEGTDLTYWIPNKYGFIPKRNDIARIYGELKGKPIKVKQKDRVIEYNQTQNELVRGLDIVRVTIDKETKSEKRQRVELFYTAPGKKVEIQAPTDPPLETEKEEEPEE